MKKYIILALRLSFYISALLFFQNNILIIPAILLISYLFLENKYYSFLPLLIIPFIPFYYSLIILIVFISHLIFIKHIQQKRLYAFIFFISSIIFANVILLIMNLYTLDLLYISIISIVFYSIINSFYIFYSIGIKSLTSSYNESLINLTLLLGYLILSVLYTPNEYIFYLIFIQLFFIDNRLYSLIFVVIGVLLEYILFKEINVNFISYLSTSYIPLVFLFKIEYNKIQDIFFILYSLSSLVSLIPEKKLSFENNYMKNIFTSFKEYLNEINQEYSRLVVLKELKKNHIEMLQNVYCKFCILDTKCKKKLDARYIFLSNAANFNDNNIYSCPHYGNFLLNTNIEFRTKEIPYNSLTELSYEIEYLYNQSLKGDKDYNKFISSLQFYGYEINKINLYFKSKTLFFSIHTIGKKPIPELITVLASKIFKMEIEIKILNKANYDEVYIYKRPRVKLDYSHQILAKDDNCLSGDNYFIKRDYNDEYIFALSDGMGSGHNAYLESAGTLDLLKRLLNYNFSLRTTLKMLENIYELKCEYDSYATLDVLQVNTSNMTMSLYKLGSTSTYIYHNNDLIVYENKSLPYKLDDLNSSYEIEYFIDDVILLISDGISDFISKNDLLTNVNFSNSSNNILDDILELINKKEKNGLKDDASVIVIKIQ